MNNCNPGLQRWDRLTAGGWDGGGNMEKLDREGIGDDFWRAVEPLIPQGRRVEGRSYQRRPGGGRKARYDDRLYLAAILYVLRTGIVWSALPRARFQGIGVAAVHRRFRCWVLRGFFEALWRHGLAEHEEMEGIAWCWQSDSSGGRSRPVAVEVAPYSGKGGRRRGRGATSGQRRWLPLVACRNREPRSDSSSPAELPTGNG